MKKCTFCIVSFLLLLVSATANAGENRMDWSISRAEITPDNPYIEFHVSYYNGKGDDSWNAGNITVSFGSYSWSIDGYSGDQIKNKKDSQQKWTYDNTQGGIRCIAGYPYKSGDDYYVKIKLYPSSVYDGQTISFGWSGTYAPNRDGYTTNCSGSSTAIASFPSDKCLSDPVFNSSALHFSAQTTTPDKSGSYTYDFYLLKEDKPISGMYGSSSSYALSDHASKTAANATLLIDVNKTPDIYFQTRYYPRYTASYNGITFYMDFSKVLETPYPLNGSGSGNDPFLISTAGDLDMFRQMVNESGHGNICGKLMTDIDYTGYTATENMIGTVDCPYTGTFDGNGKSIKLAFNSSEDYAALFRYTSNGATIGNLIVTGSVKTSKKYGAGLVASAVGTTSILNVIGEVEVSSAQNGDNTAGGIIGIVCDNVSARIRNAGFRGKLIGTGSKNNGGFVGWAGKNSTVEVLNSYFAPEQVTMSESGSYTFVRYETSYTTKISIINCYYTRKYGTSQGTLTDDDEMKSGGLAWKMNGRDAGEWLQNIGEDGYPTLWNSARVFKTEDGKYVNNQAMLPGSGTHSDPYLIASPWELELFRDMVNKGQPELCARLTADIDMSDRYWLPIGRYSDDVQVAYTGTFNGDGFTISNLSGSGKSDYEMALIGWADAGCVVKNLIMYNVHLEGLYCVAPVIGLVKGTAEIQNCGVYGVVSLAQTYTGNPSATKGKGGLVGYNTSGGAISNSYTVYGSLCQNSISNSYSYCGSTVTDMGATGELCYKLNGNDGKYFHWRQTIGTHSYPVLREGKKVYKNGSSYYNTPLSDNDNAEFTEELSSTDLRVIHHGGHLYEFIVAGGTNDGEGWHAFPDMKLAYKDGDKWIDVAELVNFNREKLDFEEDWSAEIKPLKGKFIDARTWQEQTPVFWIMQGNHSNRKYASLLWHAPAELETLPKSFRYSSSKYSNMITESKATDPVLSSDSENSIIATDPYIDSRNLTFPCSQLLLLISIQPVYSLAVWDATADKFISADEFKESQQSISTTLPAIEGYHDIVALMYGMHLNTSMKGIDTTYVTYSVPLRQKPTHTVQRVRNAYNYNHRSLIEWAIACPNDSDLIGGDQFTVSRAVKPDYSDGTDIASIDISRFTSTTVENDTTFGWFSFTDDDPGAQANAERYTGTASLFDDWDIPASAKSILSGYKYPERYVYYKVRRATLAAMFGEGGNRSYKWKVLLNQVLPTIGSVKVEKTDDWATTRMVNLRISLPNPYPWDAVSAADRDAVMAEAQKRGFESRMFQWDEKAKIRIERYSFRDEWYNNADEAAKVIEVDGSKVQQDSEGNYYVLVSDIQSLPYTHYYYKAVVDNGESDYAICEEKNSPANSSKEDADECYSETLIAISNLRASLGTVPGQVNVEWDTDGALDNDIRIERCEYQRGYGELPEEDSADSKWEPLTRNGNTAIDDKALAAVVYRYRAIVSTTCRGKVYSTTAECYGYAPYFGSIEGYVKMPNGTAMPGDVTVSVKRMEKLAIRNVYTPDSTVLLMPGYSDDGNTYSVKADESGFFRCDSLPFYGTGMQYEVQAHCSGAAFEGPSGSPVVTITLENSHFNFEEIDFVCNDTRQFSGRILYANSTIPVRDMHFRVNGIDLQKVDGSLVSTDAMGNFSFSVPHTEVTVQAYKQGHRLSGDGYILGGPDKDQRTFTPEQDYDGLTLTDSTSIRLVGRIAGGDMEGSKPLGMGISRNNIGDSITLVLQLEGDNKSYIHFNRMNPEETSRSEVFTQAVSVNGNKEMRNRTHADFQQKRIVVKADNATGEFCMDLAPARYKVSQMYANGYSNLYGDGEGSIILDLTDSIENSIHTYDLTLGDNASTHLETSYCAEFNRIFHTPVTLVMEQLNGSSAVKYFGEEKMKVSTLTGSHDMQIAWYDAEAKEEKYSFGHPVFQGNRYYQFRIRAFEEYKYNNNPDGSLTRVPVGGKKVTVSNGFRTAGEPEYVELGCDGPGKGTAFYGFLVDNATFNAGDADALFNIQASVDVNGLSYQAEPVYGYATGSRDMGVEVQNALESSPNIIDYIRDPYGAESYAYREAGTTYNWARSYEKINSGNFSFSIMAGLNFNMNVGLFLSKNSSMEIPLAQLEMTIPTQNDITSTDGEFSMTLAERISTSADPDDIGAMADIYIGNISTVDVRKYQSFCIIDAETYRYNQPAFESGAMRLVAEGVTENGTMQYLAIGDSYGMADGEERVFAYSQKHIMGVLIPALEQQRDAALRLAENEAEAHSRANASGVTFYWEDNGEYLPAYPASMKVRKDTVNLCNQRIKDWQDVIAANEKLKYEILSEKPSSAYSIAGVAIEHSEEASTYNRKYEVSGPLHVDWNLGTGDIGNGTDSNQDTEDTKIKTTGLLFNFSVGGGTQEEKSCAFQNFECINAGSGYYLSTNSNGYSDIDVYQVADETLIAPDKDLKDDINSYESGKSVNGYKVKTINGTKVDDHSGLTMDEYNSALHNYVFVQRGGASRNPWIDADSTFFYKPDGKRVPLGSRTLKIDNPKIYVENPVVNNQPQDEKAVFNLRLSNETEINERSEYLSGSSVFLSVDQASNPDGAILTVDGVPLNTNMEFFVNPGETITKTLEVARGGKPYDYENIGLTLSDASWSLCDEAYISVHYVPASSPVNISQPADNWLINTQSQMDSEGKYYIPVQIDGFSTALYDNFDHIELQYRKQTESEDQWVNLCSYYADDSLYAEASGTKQMITTAGKISNIRFYGENDPIEMKYDLRAVSFSRLGNGFVTRTSEVVSGTKDTRRPDAFNLPKPADGILDFDDVISLPFSEGIAYNYLDETVNFSVQGYTNNSDADHSSYLYFPGTASQSALSKVSRSLSYQDFTVEAMVKVEGAGASYADKAVIIGFSDTDGLISEPDNAFVFAYDTDKDALCCMVGESQYYSESLRKYGLTLSSAMTHVAITYSAADSTVQFFVGQEQVPLNAASARIKCVCRANGLVSLGRNFKGSIGDVRLWNKVLSSNEIATKYQKHLSSEEKNLIGCWPMTETTGNMVADIAGGADLYLNGIVWQTPTGYSLRADHQPVELTPKAELKFTRDRSQDYTLTFWFRADDNGSVKNSVLFSAGGDLLDEKGKDKMRIAFKDGGLVLVSEGNTVSFGANTESLNATAWHNVGIAVNHSRNVASLFLDGSMTNEVSAEQIGGIAGSYIAFGDDSFCGNFDNITLWDMALPSLYYAMNYNVGLSGSEAELAVNMNFEQNLMNGQGSMYLAFSPYNNVIVKSTGQIAGELMVDESTVTPDRTLYAPVRTGATLQNLPFSWKSTDDELLITINKADADINHQYINLVVRNVEDLNGNLMKNAQMWSVYVNRNVLVWDESTKLVNLVTGQDTTLVASWKNKSGRKISYRLETSAPWLKLVNTKGTMMPLGEGEALLSVSDGMAPGLYSAVVYLTDEDNLVSQMTVYVTVRANFNLPEVTADQDYTNSMNVIAKVCKRDKSGNWKVDMSPKDVVAAFIDRVCVGKANLTVDFANNSSKLFMTVLGNSSAANQPVEFRLYNAADGQIYTLETGHTVNGVWQPEPLTFAHSKVIGTDESLEMRTSAAMVQSIGLNKGWNWVSFNVKTGTANFNELFLDKTVFTTGDAIVHAGDGFTTFQSDGRWDATLDNMNPGKDNVYQIYMHSPGNITVKGSAFEESERSVTLRFNKSDWAEMAYLLDVPQPINIALSDFVAGSDKAPAGTVIKNHDQFAEAQKDGSWVGSLQYLRPGEGYFVRRNGLRDEVTVKYTNVSSGSVLASPGRTSGTGTLADASEYRGSMPVIATYKDGGYRQGDILLAISGDRVVGYAEADEDGKLFFLNVNADNGAGIRFANLRDGAVTDVTSTQIRYDDEGVLGTPEIPYVIDFTHTDAEFIYDLSGVRYNDIKSLNEHEGVFIIDGQKVFK